MDLLAVDDVFGQQRDFGRLQVIGELGNRRVLGLAIALRWIRRRGFVELLVGARAAAVEQRVQGLLLSAAGETPQTLGARARVDAARLSLRERAREAAAAAGLLHGLAVHGHGRAHGASLVVARFAWDVGGEEGTRELQQSERGGQDGRAEQHGPGSGSGGGNGGLCAGTTPLKR